MEPIQIERNRELESDLAHGATDGFNCTVSGSFHIAPVAGSTISIPINPPNKMLPKYQPLSLDTTGTEP